MLHSHTILHPPWQCTADPSSAMHSMSTNIEAPHGPRLGPEPLGPTPRSSAPNDVHRNLKSHASAGSDSRQGQSKTRVQGMHITNTGSLRSAVSFRQGMSLFSHGSCSSGVSGSGLRSFYFLAVCGYANWSLAPYQLMRCPQHLLLLSSAVDGPVTRMPRKATRWTYAEVPMVLRFGRLELVSLITPPVTVRIRCHLKLAQIQRECWSPILIRTTGKPTTMHLATFLPEFHAQGAKFEQQRLDTELLVNSTGRGCKMNPTHKAHPLKAHLVLHEP